MSLSAPYDQNEESGSILLTLDPRRFGSFPAGVIWRGARLAKKGEFHVTLLHARSISKLRELANQDIARFFDSFVEKFSLGLISFIDDFRYAEEAEKRTILVRCVVSELDALFREFGKKFGIALPTQPAHVTLYTLQKNAGIHINSDTTMQGLERVDLPELEVAFATILKAT